MTSPDQWQMIGFAGQGIFTARFLVQWVESEKKRDSVIPTAFWWLSIAGGLTLLTYSIYRRDPVFIVGQSLGLVVYGRNLMLVAKKQKRAARTATPPRAVPGPHLARFTHLPEIAREEFRTLHVE